MLGGNYRELHKHLKDDGLFVDNDELFIIDDYHFNNSRKQKTRQYFIDAFKDTGVRNITIYIQARNYKQETMDRIRNYCIARGLDYRHFISLQTLVGIPVWRNNEITAGQWTQKDRDNLWKNSNIAIDFIRAMGDNEIDVKYQYYENLGIRPPFHGRYWLTPSGKGYIVDGSLNTIEKDIVFVQLMDEENYGLVKILFDIIRERHCEGYVPMGIDEIMDFREELANE